MLINADLETRKDEFHRASLGIRNPRVVTLQAGDALFRFASTQSPKPRNQSTQPENRGFDPFLRMGQGALVVPGSGLSKDHRPPSSELAGPGYHRSSRRGGSPLLEPAGRLHRGPAAL